MRKVLAVATLVSMTLAGLLVTGIVDETYILFFFGLAGVPSDLTADVLQRAFDAFSRSDWKSLGAISRPFLQSALLIYFLRSVLFLVASVLTLMWALPYLKIAFQSLRHLEKDQYADLETLSDEARRGHAVRALRTRSARKRIESYAFLTAALLSLAMAIGFVTRDYGSERPNALPWDATSTSDALNTAEGILRDTRHDQSERFREVQHHEMELLSAARDEMQKFEPRRSTDLTHSNQAILSALLSRQPTSQLPQTSNTPEVAREYVTFAKAQLEVVNRQAELELLQRTVLVVITKVAAVILILALSHTLVRLYQRGLNLSVEYDAIADAVQIGSREITGALHELREALTPHLPQERNVKVPESYWHALKQLLASIKKE